MHKIWHFSLQYAYKLHIFIGTLGLLYIICPWYFWTLLGTDQKESLLRIVAHIDHYCIARFLMFNFLMVRQRAALNHDFTISSSSMVFPGLLRGRDGPICCLWLAQQILGVFKLYVLIGVGSWDSYKNEFMLDNCDIKQWGKCEVEVF